MRRTTFLLAGCIGLLIGLFLSKFTTPLATAWLFCVVFALPLLFAPKPVKLLYVCVGCMIIGWWRGGLFQAQYQDFSTHYYKKVTITGRALEDGSYGNNSQLETTLANLTIDGTNYAGKITVRGFGTPAIYRYDTLEVTGKLYPTRGGKQGVMSYADISVTGRAESRIEAFRRNFVTGLQNAVPEPAASFGIGLLVGQRSLLPDNISDALKIAGLTHIVAVSGYNLTIIVNAVRRGSKRLSRFQTVVVSGSLMYVFLLITGFSPSIVRASLVAGLGLAAWYFGRTFRPSVLILFTAALTALVNPFYVWGDLGWYLSFLAFCGILIVAPLLTKLVIRSKSEAPLLLAVALESFSAQIMTVPLIMFTFSKISLIGFVANIVIVPLVPLAMLFSLFAGLAGMSLPQLAGWVGLPARILLNSMLNVSEWFASLPHATALVGISAGSMMLLYGCIALWIVSIKKRTQSVIIQDK